MKYLRGFMMAWGNFSGIPCPYHGWHKEARRGMLCMLPLVGVLLGAVTVGAWALLDLMGASALLTGTVLTVVYFISTGFIHLDGFMDCSDAILSGRPREEKQRILKDSKVGAFAVISLVLMLMVFAVSMTVLAEEFSLPKALVVVGILTVTRGISADAVLRKPAMGSSQYVDLEGGGSVDRRDSKQYNANQIGETVVMVVTTFFPLLLLCYAARHHMIFFLGAVLIGMLVSHVTGMCDRKTLGGMSGDISGHMIVMGEVFGLLTAALLWSYLIL